MWNLLEAINLIRRLEPLARATGWHLGICGGVLQRGSSGHDLDILVFPHHTTEKPSLLAFEELLVTEGFHNFHKIDFFHPHDAKLVIAAEVNKKRVDFIYLY